MKYEADRVERAVRGALVIGFVTGSVVTTLSWLFFLPL